MEQKSIKKNYIFNTLYQIFTLIVPFITAPYISRVLGAERIGVFSYTNSIVSIFSIFALLGTSVYGQQTIAQCRDDLIERSKAFWEIELLCIINTSIVILAWTVFVIFVGKYQMFFLILTLNLFAVGFDISWFFAGLEDFSLIVIRNFIIKLLTIISIFIFIKRPDDLVYYFLIQTVGLLLGNISMWIPLKTRVKKINKNNLHFSSHFKQTIVYFIPTVAASIYQYIDKTMLGSITDSTVQNGYYEQAQKIFTMGYTVVASLNTVMASRISYLFSKNDDEEIRRRFKQSSDFIALIAYPIVFGIIGISKVFVPVFFGPNYEPVIVLLRIGGFLVLLLSIHNFLAAQYLVPSGQRARSTWGCVAGAVVNLVFNFVLIPRFFAIGALIATIISECSICCIYFWMSKDFIPIKMFLISSVKPLIGSVIMLFIVLLIGCITMNDILCLIIQISIGSIVYFITLLFFKDDFVLMIIKQFCERLGK